MTKENEDRFITLSLAFEVYGRETEELKNEGYMISFCCVTPKGEEFINKYIEDHKHAVLDSMRKNHCSLCEVQEELNFQNYLTIVKICDRLCEDGYLVNSGGYDYRLKD
ncbi:MAG TPA: hypothetical protein DER60_09215 [Syntrophomonas sp.]|nr:hypothetical protein [Syntrophomonas sp.]